MRIVCNLFIQLNIPKLMFKIIYGNISGYNESSFILFSVFGGGKFRTNELDFPVNFTYQKHTQ
jgi:hypothetical protein